LEFASLWVLDTISQCQRLCQQHLGAGHYGYLVRRIIAIAVEARSKEGPKVDVADLSEEEEERNAEDPSDPPAVYF
jgi:hypothetical protein